ncbi:MAG: Uma2 family endonuclease [Tepidisphaeraceae bacterium]
MTAAAVPSSHPSLVAKFENGAEWWHALGDVPLERIVMDPPPGTATEQDLLWFVEAGDRLVELVDGTLVEKGMGYDESEIAIRLAHFIMTWVLPRKLGSVAGADATLRMKRGNVRLPDISFIVAARIAALPKPHPAIPSLSPDLAVEVLSESNTKPEIARKLKEYFESGTRLAWIIDPPRKTLAVFTGATENPDRVLSEHETVDGGDVLPGFALRIAELFPDAA